ncbi:fibronectin type III domain-containing protein [Geomonas oryzae]|uniref:fibronectin type III domain-containing protein n=1 Tax=Geomonas oryzae TaxID=2364273 RepID=UPI001FEA4DBD|nr:fibronectin type III domain-containing protein [Geomonas oryzae]
MTVLSMSDYGLTITPPTGSGFGTLRLTTGITTNVRQNIILALPDKAAPVILTGPTVASKTDTTATIEWQTDEPAKGGAVYGVSDPPGTTAAEASFATTHSVQLTGLIANTTYYVRVNATDLYGNGPATSTVISFTTMPTPDKTPPTILTGPTVSSITQASTVVEWTTDEPTTGGVIYGLTATPDQTVTDTVTSTTHRITLTGLSSETDYYLKVTATDTAGNGPVSAIGSSFRTLAAPDTTAPVINEGPMVTSVSDTGATVEWVTDEPSTTGVSYNDGVAHGVYNDDTLTTSHSAKLTGLAPTKTYNFTVSSKDTFGNGPTLSKEGSFTTKAAPDTAAPVFTQIPIVKNTTHQSVVLYWETDEGAACTIQYGTSESLGMEDAKTELNMVHNRALTGLLPGTIYYFRVVANDAAKNTVTSKTYSFKTELIPDTNPPVITKEAAVIYSNDRAATIAFETDKPCDTVIKYGPNGSLGLQKSSSDKVNEHQTTLTNLEGNTSYTVQVSCTDMSGNTVVASAGTPSTYLAMNYAFILSDAVIGAAGNGFMTKSVADTTAPVITEIPQAIAVTSNMARIHWLTDEIADSQVLYALQGQPLTNAAGSIVKSAGHSVALTNLQAGTTYQFKIRSTDPAGNTTESGVYSFTTAALPDTTPPVISAISALGGDRKIDVKWNTDEPSTTVLRYGTTPLALTGQVSVSGSRTSHAVTLYNLVPGTTYYVAPQAVDGSGNSTQGGTQQLTLGGAAPTSFTVTATSGSGGTIAPASQQVFSGYQLALAVQPAQGYLIKSVAGCGGTLSGNVFTTAAITGSCAVSATFTPDPAQVVPLTSTAKPAPGTYSGGTLLVRLSASRPGATIYYTTDGTTPLLSPKTYSGPIAVTGTQTVKFLAKDDFDTEAVNSATYTVNTDGQPSATYDGKSGSSFTVTRQSATGSATVYSGTQKSFTDSGTLTPNTIYTYSVASDSEGATELMSVRTPLYTGWNIVAVPFDLASGISPSSLFGSQVSAVYQWTPSGATAEDSTAVLGFYKNVTTLLPGYGYFVKAGTAGTTFAYSGSSAPQNVDVILKPGWTMIANPNSTVKTDIATNWLVDGSPLGTAVVANKIGGGIYWWNGTTYDSWSIVNGNPQIEPWKGYWILNLDSTNHSLTIK